MTLCRHRTRSVFDRYSNVSEGDLRAAVSKLDAAGTISGTIDNAATGPGN
jgi:hypothetical protein